MLGLPDLLNSNEDWCLDTSGFMSRFEEHEAKWLLSHFEEHEEKCCDVPGNNPTSAMAPCEDPLINLYYIPRRGGMSLFQMEKGKSFTQDHIGE